MYSLKTVSIDWSTLKASIEMKKVSGKFFPAEYDVDRNKDYPCAYVNYTVIVKGDITLLSVRPTTRAMMVDVWIVVNGNTISFGYQTRYSNLDLSDTVKANVKEYLNSIRGQAPDIELAINEDIAKFNSTINEYAKQELSKRMISIQKEKDLLDDLI